MHNRTRSILVAGTITLLAAPAALAGGEDCPADVDGNGAVDVVDLLEVLANWGPCPGCPADIDGDGEVAVSDLLEVLAGWGPCPGTAVVMPRQLAGNSLGEYPHFEFVRAINKGVGFEVAVDPSRTNELIGETVDIYVVESKTAAEWDADPSLTDETGGAQSETIVGGSVADNRWGIDGSNTLTPAAGRSMGHPYDVVIDSNRNGVLDGGDYIDGYDDTEAGLYVVHNIASPGPYDVTESSAYSVGTVFGIVSTRTIEEVYYPTDVADLGELPLIVVSHGNGHQYIWYDHIGYHMASYGYVVMSHQNNTGPGIPTAAQTTLGHTDAFLDQLDTIEGGVLDGHVDSDRIVWIGHSRGGEGVAYATDRIIDGSYIPTNYALESLQLVSSIAPTDFLGVNSANPHGVSYHLWTGGADADVNGCASCNICQTFHLHDRAEGYRQSISLHGVGHGAFHSGTGSLVATGPCQVSRALTHDIMRPHFLALCEHYVFGNIPAKDYFTRQYESFRAIGAPTGTCIVVDMMYRDSPDAGNFMVDDYQAETATSVSSSGGAVTFDVTSIWEGRADDQDSSFTHNPSDEMNGTTLGASADSTKCVVFEWAATNRFYELEVVEGSRDVSGYNHFSFRAAQGTRHPNTIADLADLLFDVTLRDGSGTTSTIRIGAYGGGIEEPYQRTSCGSGVGWANEFETVMMRVEDFLADGSGLDLTDIEAVRFDFGPAHGAAQGRLNLDEIQFTVD